MSEEIAISVEHVSKAYRIWESPSARLMSPLKEGLSGLLPKKSPSAQYLRDQAAKHYKDFYALRDVSFTLGRGESAGIIGRNGSGKSTLLQIIAGTLQPTEGSVKVNGRVAALLELGAGFNPDFTGRENVHLSAAVLGISRQEIEHRFDEIAAFADIGDFLDQAVKTYSSGMMMRLAFAVNTCVDPDILIVDEALSVGDAPFQAKCFRRLRQLIDKGVSLLFVSHDIGTVRSICSRALWLKGGKSEMWGEAKEVAKEYEKFCWKEQGVTLGDQTPATTSNESTSPKVNDVGQSPEGAKKVDALLEEVGKLDAGIDRFGTRTVFIRRIAMMDEERKPKKEFTFGETVTLFFVLEANTSFSGKVRLGIRIKSVKQDFILTISDLEASLTFDLQLGATATVSYDFSLPLTEGHYSLLVALFEVTPISEIIPEAYDFSNAVIFDSLDQVCPFYIRRHTPIPAVGPVHFNCRPQLHEKRT